MMLRNRLLKHRRAVLLIALPGLTGLLGLFLATSSQALFFAPRSVVVKPTVTMGMMTAVAIDEEAEVGLLGATPLLPTSEKQALQNLSAAIAEHDLAGMLQSYVALRDLYIREENFAEALIFQQQATNLEQRLVHRQRKEAVARFTSGTVQTTASTSARDAATPPLDRARQFPNNGALHALCLVCVSGFLLLFLARLFQRYEKAIKLLDAP